MMRDHRQRIRARKALDERRVGNDHPLEETTQRSRGHQATRPPNRRATPGGSRRSFSDLGLDFALSGECQRPA
jgi:hypothetical protein